MVRHFEQFRLKKNRFYTKYLKSFKVFLTFSVFLVLPIIILSSGCSLFIRGVQKLHLSQHHCCASYQC